MRASSFIVQSILSLTHLSTNSLCLAMHEWRLYLNWQVRGWHRTVALNNSFTYHIMFWDYSLIKRNLQFKLLLLHRKWDNMDKCHHSVSQIPMQWKVLKCSETVSQGIRSGGSIHVVNLLTSGIFTVNATLAQLCSCIEPSLVFATGPTSTHQRVTWPRV